MKHPSAKTSVSQIPSAYTEPKLASVYQCAKNLDYGGGRYEVATEHLELHYGCTNLVYDPYWRTPAHNIDVIRNLDFDGSTSAISCLNVLNVLLDKKDRDEAIEAIKYLANSYSGIRHLVFQVYTKDSTGVPTKTQLNKKPEYYLESLTAPFGSWSCEILGDKKNIIHFWR